MPSCGWAPELGRLVRAGLIDGEAILQGRLTVESVSRSNQVGIVRIDDHPVVVLKRDEIAVDGVDPFLAEVDAYRWLARDPATAALAPALVTAHDGVLVLEPVVGHRLLHEALMSLRPASLLAALGRQLAVLHSGAAGDRRHDRHARPTLRLRRPWVLDVARGALPDILAPDPEIAALAGEMAADALLRAALEELDRAWSGAAPMHGDVKFDNVLVRCDGAGAEAHVMLLDWELAGLGLPVWDLAGVLDGLMVPALVDVDTDTALESMERADPALAAYRLGMSGLAPSRHSLLVATVARLLQSSLQLQAMRHSRPEAAECSRRVLTGARRLAERLERQPRAAAS